MTEPPVGSLQPLSIQPPPVRLGTGRHPSGTHYPSPCQVFNMYLRIFPPRRRGPTRPSSTILDESLEKDLRGPDSTLQDLTTAPSPTPVDFLRGETRSQVCPPPSDDKGRDTKPGLPEPTVGSGSKVGSSPGRQSPSVKKIKGKVGKSRLFKWS